MSKTGFSIPAKVPGGPIVSVGWGEPLQTVEPLTASPTSRYSRYKTQNRAIFVNEKFFATKTLATPDATKRRGEIYGNGLAISSDQKIGWKSATFRVGKSQTHCTSMQK